MGEEGFEKPAAPPAQVLAALRSGHLTLEGRLLYSSNQTFLATVTHADRQFLAVYKPKDGERPLWDFPPGTLWKREIAAYLVSEALDFGLVPPTVKCRGPYGIGSLQLFIMHDPADHLLTLYLEGGYEATLQLLSAFDYLINNADRKSGHVLKGEDGRIWAIDHGVCFHPEAKLRTILWQFSGQPLLPEVQAGLQRLQISLATQSPPFTALAKLLLPPELKALKQRLETLLTSGLHPDPGPGLNVPWPPI